jgi:hypothetical protein
MMQQIRLLALLQQIHLHLVQQLDLELRQFFQILQLRDLDQRHHLLEFLRELLLVLQPMQQTAAAVLM